MPQNLLSAVKTHQGILLLLFLSSLLFLTNIGSYGQLLRAETNFSIGARMMVETQKFLLPHAPHEQALNKPPLQNWLIGLSYMIFGFSHGASRVPSALCGLGVLILVYILGLRLRDQCVGLAASAMLATSYIFWSFSRLCMPDMLLTFCITAALFCWILVLTDQTKHAHLFALIGSGAVGIGFLAKGPVAIVMALLPICLEIMITRDLHILKRLKFIQGSVVFLLVAAPYFLLVYVVDGVEPLQNFFIKENLGRFAGSTYHTSSIMFVYEVSALLANFAPWTPLFLISLCSLGRWRKLDTLTQRQLRLLFLWVISPIVFFSLSSFKLDYYFLPAMPAVALIVAQCFLQEGVLPLWAKRGGFTISAVLLLVLLPFLVYFTALIVKANFPNSSLAWLPHIIAILTLLPGAWFAIRGRTYCAILVFSSAIWAIIFSSYFVLLPEYTRFQPAAMLATKVPTTSNVYIAGSAHEWMWDLALYLPTVQPVEALPAQNLNLQISNIFQTTPGAVILMYDTEYRALRKVDSEIRVIAQADAYKNNRLTIKSLSKPRYEQLYLVTK